MVIFLSNFLALLIKVDATESNQNVLGGSMVAINVMLIGAVLIATWFATQKRVQDHRDGETVIGVAATMLTFEQHVAASTRFTRQQASASLSSSGSSRSRGDGVLALIEEATEIDASGVGPVSPDAKPNPSNAVMLRTDVQRRGSRHFGSSDDVDV